MLIRQELLSYTGHYRCATLEDVDPNRLSTAISTVKPLDKPTPVIWVDCAKDDGTRTRYPIIFTRISLRDAAFEIIRNAQHSDTIVLDLNTIFFPTVKPDEEMEKLIKHILSKVLRERIKTFLKDNVQSTVIEKMPVFSQFNFYEMENIMDPQLATSIDYRSKFKPDVASKTLFVPQFLLEQGVSPLQYWKILLQKQLAI